MTKSEIELIDKFVDFIISENCEGCSECEPRLSMQFQPGIVCIEEGRAKWLLDVAKRFKSEVE